MKKSLFIGYLVVTSAFLNGCSELIPKATELPSFYLLNGVKLEDKATENESITSKDNREGIVKNWVILRKLVISE